jgi:hypothetical protein
MLDPFAGSTIVTLRAPGAVVGVRVALGVGVRVKVGVRVGATVGVAVGVGLRPARASETAPTESINRTTSGILRSSIFASPRKHARRTEQAPFRLAPAPSARVDGPHAAEHRHSTDSARRKRAESSEKLPADQ